MRNKNDKLLEKWDFVEGIGELWTEIVLVFGNEPVLFVCKNALNQRYLVMTYSEMECIYVITRISTENLFKMIRNLITMKDAFISGKTIYVTSWDGEKLLTEKYKSASFSQEMLPKDGANYDLSNKEIDEYCKILYSEIERRRHWKSNLITGTVGLVAAAALIMFLIYRSITVIDSEDVIPNNETLVEDNNDLEPKQSDLVDNTDYQEVNSEVLSIIRVEKQNEIYLSDFSTINISKDDVLIDTNNVSYDPQKLVGRTLCLSFNNKLGYDILFVGQYDNELHWDGLCYLCAYYAGDLLYTTEDEYVSGEVSSYKRLSNNGKKWFYTEKIIDDHGLYFGDTYSYAYKQIVAKDYDLNIPQREDLTNISEVLVVINEGIKSHYHGQYDSEQNWDDDSGDAYCVKYQSTTPIEVYKGTFFNNHYGTGWMIKKISNDEFNIVSGTINSLDSSANTVISSDTVKDTSIIKAYIQGEPFEQELADWIH